MTDIGDEDHAAIEEQLRVLQEEKELLEEEYEKGNISESEYKKSLNYLNFREAQLRERNQQKHEREQQTLTREHDRFSD